jgi:hypothetical protein
MWKVLSPVICRETAETLQHCLNITYPIDYEKKVNWGNSKFLLHDPVEVFGNKTEAVARSSAKNRFFSLCQGLGTVPVLQRWEGPCFQHINASGSNSSGVVYVDKEEDYRPGILTTKAIEGEEFRVYFCYGNKKVYKKALLPNAQHNPIKNSERYGYINATEDFKRVTGLEDILYELTTDVAKRLELQYGAVDFIMDKKYKVWVLESNSAPTLFNHNLVSLFTHAIKENLS